MSIVLILGLSRQVVFSSAALLVEWGKSALLVRAQEILTPTVAKQRRVLYSRTLTQDVVLHK